MWQFWLYLSLTLISDVCAITLGKHYSTTHNKLYLLASVVAFAITGLFFCLSLNYKGIAMANILWAAFASILIAAVGYFFFKEPITTIQWIGISVIVVGLALVHYE